MEQNDILKNEFSALSEAVKTAKHEYHSFSFATLRLNKPEIRTVILREIDNQKNTIAFHSDIRSSKLDDIKMNNNVSALFYDKVRRIQLRINGEASIDKGSPKLKSSWDAMKPESKLCYMGPYAPSKELNSFLVNLPNHNAQNISAKSDALGYSRFCKITIKIKSMDWLHLKHTGHERLLFSFDKKITSKWIAS
tara:strand:+ start:593 stop:1174 length:582 start_codon:yes stop_codon:yes gene_type:complete